MDLSGEIGVFELAACRERTATGSGAAVDMWAKNGPRELVAMLSVGSSSGSASGQTLNAKLQHGTSSASGDSSWADLTGGAFSQIGSAANSGSVKVAGFKQYVRVVWVHGGTNPMYQFGVVGVAGHPHHYPVG